MSIDSFIAFRSPGPGGVAIEGESLDSEMQKEKAFQISNFSWGAENPLDVTSGTGGAGLGKMNFKELSFDKQFDRGSPGLFQTCCSGGHYEQVDIYMRKAGGDKKKSGVTFLRIHARLCAIKELSWDGSEDEVKESIIMEIGAVQIDYRPQKEDGTLLATITAVWSRITNTATLDIKGGKAKAD